VSRPSPYMQSAEAFWLNASPEPNTGCFAWMGPFQKGSGYGAACYRGRTFVAHWAAVYWATGAWPGPGDVVLHRCDNKWCVNPAHLDVGTQSRNVKDAIRRCRGLVFQPSLHRQHLSQSAA
jgi:hypothetical protein